MTALGPARLIVALDVPRLDDALALAHALAPLGILFKVGYEALFAYGDALRDALAAAAFETFVDAKLHDIPRTVEAAVRALVRPGVRIVTVHALGGHEMMVAAVEAGRERARELAIAVPDVFAVTLLTSHAAEDLGELGLLGGPGENTMRLAALARDARCAGVVCAAGDVPDLKTYFGSDFAALCPGIRPAGSAHGDQKRVATPSEAVAAGANYLVVGRPIVAARDPVAAARAILQEMAVGAG